MAMRPRGGGVGPNRPYRPPREAARPVNEDFRPVFERHQEEEAELLLIYLPGFKKENIRVSTEGKNTVRVRGEHFVAGNKWNRFQEDFQAPDDCNMRGIRAKFENGILTITMPWKIPKQFDEPTELTPLTIPPPPPQKDDFPTKQTLTTPPPPQKDDNIPSKATNPTIETPVKPRKPTPLKPTAQLPKPQGVKEEQRDEKKILEGQSGSSVESSKTPKGDEDIEFPALQRTTLGKNSGEKEKEKKILEGQMGSTAESSKTPKGNETLGFPPFKATPLGKTSGETEKPGDEKKILEGVVGSIEPKIQKSKEEEKLDQNNTQLVKSGKEVEKKDIHATEGKDTKKSKELRDFQEKVEHRGSKEKESASNVAAGTSSYPGGEFSIGNLKRNLVELNEDQRQLLINACAAVLVIMALGAYVYHSIGSGRTE